MCVLVCFTTHATAQFTVLALWLQLKISWIVYFTTHANAQLTQPELWPQLKISWIKIDTEAFCTTTIQNKRKYKLLYTLSKLIPR